MPLIKARSSSIIESVDLRGQPTAPTAEQTTNTNQLASTAFVRTAIADLIDSSPELLNTLNELAAALGNDPDFATTVANSIATKLPKDGSEAMTGELTLAGDPTGNLGAVTKQYVDAAIDEQMIYSTDDVAEGNTNLYYTDTRVRSAVSLASDNTVVLDYDSLTGQFTYNHPTSDGILEGSTNLYFSESRARNSISMNSDDGTIISYSATTGEITFTTPDTDKIVEGQTNLYFTTARARASINNGSNINYDSSTGTISTQAAVWSVNGQEHDVVLDTDDVSEGSANLYFTNARARSAVNLTTDDSNILSYNGGTGVFTFVTPTTDAIDEGSVNLYYTDSRVRTAISASGDISYNQATGNFSYSTPTTDGVNEGSTNLYFTDARARNAVSLNSDNTDVLSYDNTTGEFTFSLGSQTTDDVAEGSTNLYYTDARARSAINVNSDWDNISYNSTTGVVTVNAPNTNDVTEGTNLYFTDARAREAISVSDAGGDGSLSYDDVTGVLTYTGPSDSEVRAHFSVTDSGGDGSLSYDNSTGVFTYTGPSDSEVRAHFSATTATGAQYDNTTGVFSLSGIPNSSLTNDSVTVNGSTVALGGSTSFGTDSVTEENNLYFTDGRARAAISLTSDNTSVLDYDALTGEFTFSLGSQTTDDVAEGTTNLYYTDTRARNAVSATDAGGDGSFSYDSATGVFTYTGPGASEVRAHLSATSATGVTYDSSTGVIALASIPNSSLVNTDVTINGTTVSLGGSGSFGTDSVTEEGNLYYTDARARSALSVTTSDSTVFDYDSTTGEFTFSLSGLDTSEVTEDPAATTSSGTMYFTNARARDAVSATDAGGDGSFSYDSATGVFTYTGPSAAEARAHFSATTSTGVTYDSSTGVIALASIPNSSLVNTDVTINGTTVTLGGSGSFGTDSVTEESNLYYTDARARAAISLTTSDAGVLSYDSATGVLTFDNTGLTTDEVTEGSTNLYYTDTRARNSISTNGWQISYDSGSGVISMATPDTDDVSEGTTNKYFTNARARTAVSLTTDNTDAMSYDNTTGVFTFTLATVDTDEIAEGPTNLYFTTARARASVNNGANIDYDSSTGTISTQAAVWSVNGQTHDVVLDTDDVSEGSTNLYFTDARARSAITLTTDDSNILSYNTGTGALTFVTPTTDAIDEGAVNLYYTDARADGRIAVASIRDLADVDADDALQDGYTLVWSSTRGEFVPQNVAVTATTLNFTGDGTTTSFSTGVEVSSIDNTQVFINGLIQAPTYSYTISTTSGVTSIVFDTAPETNDYIFVRVTATSSLTAGGVLNESSTVDGGSF